ncbi:MAG: hypothetical protein GY765_20645 [bacterium]|nr:hypothetical protein [bacterium]
MKKRKYTKKNQSKSPATRGIGKSPCAEKTTRTRRKRKKSYSTDTLLWDTKQMLYRALHYKETSECASRVGYTDARIHEAKAMLDEVYAEWNDLKSEKIDAKYTTRNYKELRAKAHKFYRDVVNLVRIILREEPDTLEQLCTTVKIGSGYEDWVNGVDGFYGTALSEPVLSKLQRFNANDKLLREGREMVAEVRRAWEKKEAIRQKVKEKTASKNKLLKKLTDWVSRYKTLMRIAAAHGPDVLAVKPAKRRKEKKRKLKRMGIE